MEILEKAFGKINGIFEDKFDAKKCYFHQESKRLSQLTSILFKHSQNIKIINDKSGFDGRFIYLPSEYSVFNEYEKNKLLFELKIFLTYSLSKYFHLKKTGEDSETPQKFLRQAWIDLKFEFVGIEEKFSLLLDFLNKESSKDILAGHFRDSIIGIENSRFFLTDFVEGTDYSLKVSNEINETKVKEFKDEGNPLVHNFEKLKTAEEYQGGSKNLDGSNEMADHFEAIKNLKWEHVIRSMEKTSSFLKIDGSRNSEGFEIKDEMEGQKESLFKYPEYNYKKKQFLTDWCQVFEKKVVEKGEIFKRDEYRKTIEQLKSQLIYCLFAKRYKCRQRSGDQVDLDAHVDYLSEVRHGQVVCDKLFMQKRSVFREISLLFLLDTSHSMDSWKDNQRLLDLGRDCLYILTDALKDFCPQITIGTFSSLTRKNCQFKIIKSIDESMSEGMRKLSNISTEGHTRIGPALRHAQYLLEKTGSRRKIIVVLTDGKPIDYDRYEGIYGEMDIQMANYTGEKRGISTFLFSFEKENGSALARMFGRNSYEIVQNPKKIGLKFLEFIVSGK